MSTTPPTQRPGRVRWIVLGLVAFASASAYLTRYCISAANTSIQTELGFDDRVMGQLMSAFGLGYLLFQVPGGRLGQRLGTRLAFALISVCWSLCSVWSAVASAMANLAASRFCLGACQAGLTPISAKIVRDWLPLPQRGMSSACIAASMSIGGGFTLWATGWLLAQGVGWRTIFAAYALVGVAWSAVFYWYFRTQPSEHAGVGAAELATIRGAERLVEVQKPTKAEEGGPIDLTSRVVGSLSMWGLCVQSFFRAAGYVFFATWFFAFLEYKYELPRDQAGLLNSLPLIAVVLGSLSGGAIVDVLLRRTGSRWISRSGTAFVSLAACGVLTTASAWTGSATELSLVIAAGALFSGIGSPAAWAATIDLGGRRTAEVMGVMNMAGCLAGVVLPAVLGNWFDAIRKGGGDWDAVIYLHAAFYFAAAASWLVVRPARSLTD